MPRQAARIRRGLVAREGTESSLRVGCELLLVVVHIPLSHPQPLDSDDEADEGPPLFKSAYTATLSCVMPDIPIPPALVSDPSAPGACLHAVPTVALRGVP
jgi:hypothetical protein